MDDSFFDIPVELKNDLDRKIASAFNVYDHNRNLMIEDSDVGAILRSMGCVLSENEIKSIVKATEFEGYEGRIHLSRFLPHVKELLFANKFMPSRSNEILEAFKILDPKGRGYLYKDEIIKFVNEFGESFSESELKKLLDASIDPNTNRMDYELYTVQLAYEPSDSDNIYILAEQFKDEKIDKAKK